MAFSLNITRLAGLGDGVGTYQGKPVFVSKACAGDVLEVEPTHETKEHIRAEILRIITPGPDRVPAPCPHYAACGGCSLQHLRPEAYQAFKQGTLSAALKKAGAPDTPIKMHFLPPASRRRAEFKRTPEGKPAYLGARSHTLVPIDNCLILTPGLQARMGESLTLTEYDTPQGEIMCGEYAITPPPGAFLQASREAQNLMTKAVTEALAGCKSVADLFCGIGAYSFPLAANARVSAYELDAAMVSCIKTHAEKYSLKSLSAHKRDLFKKPLTPKELATFDGIAINPPRAGANAQAQQIPKARIPKVVIISCNPATFARDAKTLIDAGYQLDSALGIDQFVYSAHLEIVGVFTLGTVPSPRKGEG